MFRRNLLPILLLCAVGLSNVYAASDSDEILRAFDLIADIKKGKKIYSQCISCHHEKGWGKEDGSVPMIAAEYQRVLIKTLADIRSQPEADNPIMYKPANPATIGGAQAVADLTAYISSLPRDENSSKGKGNQLELGKKLYQSKCQQCHGEQAQGDVLDYVPKLNGQNYAYLLRKIQWLASGSSKNSKPIMVLRMKGLSAQEMEALADYISRL